MAQLVDILLVTISVVIAIWYTAKYFFNLGKTPKSGSISCSGCNSSCHTDIPDNPSLALLKKFN
ncbi:MAG: hypothetical protein HOD43_14390 [Candidatus Marinimicrobia bacterium]|nr:hypothetical protein [Candidatus Neomarinimicrobiota bacterium]MBT4296984.1 hypothetical protein [Candidatus Neomarinimicrobiota bacterium]MBT4993660.1 hypothetical protein [Candidatus Neomarinimicrobiota bacterium]MBT5314570.1 hypothetical protein [Candidatus Neomarinimicrobiota bacterium]MBT6003869.1 hypothetical protein [Candidatus Neomarinimicrobiota bacterium]